jgi:hypothetical protein
MRAIASTYTKEERKAIQERAAKRLEKPKAGGDIFSKVRAVQVEVKSK